MRFEQILEKYREISSSHRDVGDRFERLMQAYLKTDPRYASKFKEIWLWNEFPYRSDFGFTDTGIDLVAVTHDGDHWAIQCKCYQEDTHIDKPAVDTFLSTSSREFKDENLQTTRFAHRLWISTTNRWGGNATQAIRNQSPPFTRINLSDLIDAPVDWEKLDVGVHGEAARAPRKTPHPHQDEAVEKAHVHFQSSDRGKLIMACGTGKTFNALQIAENETDNKGLILFLVPSIALLGQTLREWSADAKKPINAICICSDPKVSEKRTRNPDRDTFSVVDLALPASTHSGEILRQFRYIQAIDSPGMTVVFSTYQSIDVIAEAQNVLLENGFNEFDLIICDEAHRTTGVTLADKDESAFIKVHDNEFIKAKKRLYMTATPRLYSDDAKSKAAEADAVLCSMDDPDLYGAEIYRIGFGEAVERDLLTDYKVLILTLNDVDVPPAVQEAIANNESEINTDDASKLIGCINALSKQFLGDDGETKKSDPAPMRRAVAFCQSIAVSKKITETYNQVTDTYLDALPSEQKQKMVSISAQHIDGTMTAPARDEMLGWLKASTENNECRVLTNVRVLSEGVDVPSLDAVLFISAKNSQVDVVQSVGRVMRISPGKKYGYIIIPVVVPADVPPEQALDDNERYRVVWTVLNALRAHDDRFNATVNKIELNKKRPSQIVVGGTEVTFDENGNPLVIEEEPDDTYERNTEIVRQMLIQFEQLQSVVFARMVKKVGDRLYWEQWAKDVATIVDRQIERIQFLVSSKQDQKAVFNTFVAGLRKNINPSISEGQAIEMLAQHIITQPIFEALFEDFSFAQNNPVSIAMQQMLGKLEGETVTDDSAKLVRFYESVRKRAAGIDNAEGKQRIIIELYDKFFKTAFPKMVEQLGIVYTPVEIVDFILHSVNDALKWEFDRRLSDENVHILDPFTGTGTFVTRLLQSDLISAKDLSRKFREELHANEIVLLAYYIAAVNIENAYHDRLSEEAGYEPFEGIVLTDTFQLGETDESQRRISEMFPQNSARVARQQKAPLRVIMGNPPYSAGQKGANDNAQNQEYIKLEAKIADTYAKASSAALKKALYNSYVKAFRWSADRLDPVHGGVIAFVTNGRWLDAHSVDGFRKEIEKEFSSIWIFNLRGNAHTQGEVRRREGGNVFGGGSRNPIAVTLLVKNPEAKTKKAVIRYHEVDDYLPRKEKLAIVSKFASIAAPDIKWRFLQPNIHGEWLHQRNTFFDALMPLGDKEGKRNHTFFVPFYSLGLCTAQDMWCYNASKSVLSANMNGLIDFYNQQRADFHHERISKPSLKLEDSIEYGATHFTWTEELKRNLVRDKELIFDTKNVITGLYRPFFKQHVYFARELNKRTYQLPKLFPDNSTTNLVICISGTGSTRGFRRL